VGASGGFAGYPDQRHASAYRARPSNKTPLIIGAIVLVLLIGGGIAAYFLLGKSSSDNKNTAANSNAAPSAADAPVDVVRKAFIALQNRDADTFKKLSTQKMAQQYDRLIEQMQKEGITLSTTEIRQGETRDDGKVVVFYKMARAGRTEEEDARVVKENGAWKLDNL
jgi:flagellar basal body-associated protein FliL